MADPRRTHVGRTDPETGTSSFHGRWIGRGPGVFRLDVAPPPARPAASDAEVRDETTRRLLVGGPAAGRDVARARLPVSPRGRVCVEPFGPQPAAMSATTSNPASRAVHWKRITRSPTRSTGPGSS